MGSDIVVDYTVGAVVKSLAAIFHCWMILPLMILQPGEQLQSLLRMPYRS
jgi:hypothetical protein